MKENGGISLSDEEYATVGPFTYIFGNPMARVLDQSLFVGNMEQTISMLSEATDLSYKTVEKAIQRLKKMGLMSFTRKIGNARAYRFEVENHLSDLIKVAQEIQLSRPEE